MSQLNLFDPDHEPVVSQRHSDTSTAAAEAIKPDTSTLRTLVFNFIRNAGGATDEEIQIALDMNPSTERPRRVELVNAGRVADSGERRKTKSGRKAVVWVTT